MNDSTESTTGNELSLPPRYPVMRKRSLIARVVERVVPAKSRFLGFVWILALGAVLLLLQGIQGEATQFYGIAGSQLRSISFQHPVEIVDIPVVEGDQVGFDERILEVRRYDLDIKLQVIDEQINEIRARQASTRHLASAEIANLKAELGARQQALTTQIDSLESAHRLNRKLLASISSEATPDSAESSPMRVRIDGLKAEQKRLGKLYRTRIDQQQQILIDLSGPGDARIAEFEKNRSELQRQSQALVVRAPFAGSIGSVLFKRGEQVAAFSSVISIQGSHPQSVKGYIYEAVSNHVQIGQSVWVQSLNAIGDNQLVRGRVDSYAIEPKLLTQYRRRAYASTVDVNARVTLDVSMKYRQQDHFSLASNGDMTSYDNETIYARDMFTDAAVILELKCNVGEVPTWMIDLISSFGLKQQGFSKYLNSTLVARLDDGIDYMRGDRMSQHFAYG